MRSIVGITHIFNKQEISGECSNPIVLLSNNKGSYFSISNDQTSYQGFSFFRNSSMYKLIDSINFLGETVKVIHSPKKTSIIKADSKQTYYLGHILICDVENYNDFVSIDLDFRDFYDFPELGRVYKYHIKNNILIIECLKYSDSSLKTLQDRFFLTILLDSIDKNSLKVEDNWISKCYSIDNKRGYSSNRYINRAISFKFVSANGRIAISYAKTEPEAIERLKHYSKINISTFSFDSIFKSSIKTKYQEDLSTLSYSLNMNIHQVLLNNKYFVKQIFAGWPWFFQFWTRDSLISLGALILTNKFDITKKILDQYLSLEHNKGLINSRIPRSELKAIDSTGWFFKRYYDFLYILVNKGRIFEFYSKDSLIKLKSQLENIFDDFIRNNMQNGLIYSGKNETWMDTNYEDNGRAGYCIEIQALTLSMIKTLCLCSILTHQRVRKRDLDIERKLILNVRKKFFKDGRIADRVCDDHADFVQRPNIFLARYVYPHLFSDEEWKSAFKNSLDALWLNWGGLSSIDKNNCGFTDIHSGSDNKSYHRGDSWYFINNIAATQLYLVDKKEFSVKIKSIFDASLKDLFFSGVIGGSSEVSSAKMQTGEGCLNQSWSSSTLIELIYLLSEENISLH